jgi:very-short-patch-repair endonuclease
MDVAPGLATRRLERLIDEADRLRVCGEAELRTAVLAHVGHRGAALVGRTLRRHEVGSTLTRLALEERFLVMCRAARLAQPLVNAEVEGYTVDFLWPRERLVAETDGWESHRTRRAFEEDRRRDARLAVVGYLVVRYTWRQVVDDPKVVAAQLRSLLRARRYSPSSDP